MFEEYQKYLMILKQGQYKIRYLTPTNIGIVFNNVHQIGRAHV